MNLTPALAPVGMALLVLAVLGAIVLLVSRDARHTVAPGSRPEEGAGGEPRQQPTDSNAPTLGQTENFSRESADCQQGA
jgi:hypothetical protein